MSVVSRDPCVEAYESNQELPVIVAIAAVVIVAVLSYVEPRIGLAAILLGYAFLPFVVGAVRVGPISLHVCTMMTLTMLAVWTVVPARHMPSSKPELFPFIPAGTMLVLAVFVAGVAVTELVVTKTPATALSFFLNYIVAPIGLFVLCCDAASRYDGFSRVVALGVVAVACVQSLLALMISLGLLQQPFESRYQRQFWWGVISRADRQLGITDHPLNLALLIAAAIPLVAIIRRGWVQVLAVVIMFAGVALTQSRIGLVAAVVGLLYLVLVGSGSGRRRLTTGIGVVIGFAVLTYFDVFGRIVERIGNDNGSSEVRNDAWENLVPMWRKFFPFGIGIDNLKPFMKSHFGSNSSPESALLGYAVGFGIPLALLFFGVLLWLAINRIRHDRTINPAVASLLIVLVAIQFFSSITTGISSTSIILWLCTFLAVTYRSPGPVVESELPEGQTADTRASEVGASEVGVAR